MKIYGRCSLSISLVSTVSACTDEILNRMRPSRLQLYADKTELIWCATPWRLSLLPVTPIRVVFEIISPSSSVRDFHVYSDADLSMRIHVAKTSVDFAGLRHADSKRSAVTATISDEDAGSVARVVKICLWQRDFDRHSNVSVVSAQRCSKDHRWPAALGAHQHNACLLLSCVPPNASSLN